MKLTEIAIIGSDIQQSIRLPRLSDGLNVVCGPTTTSSSLIRLLHQIMWGTENSSDSISESLSAAIAGHIVLDSGGNQYRLARSTHYSTTNPHGKLTVSDEFGTCQSHRTPDWLASVDRQMWSRLFTITIGQNDPASVPSLVELMIRQFDLGSSARLSDDNLPFAADMASYQEWRTASEGRATRLEFLRSELDSLQTQRDRLVEETARLDLERRVRLSTIENELAGLQTIHDSIAARIKSERGRLAGLDHEISQVGACLKREELNVQLISVNRPRTNDLALYYERLDELDSQVCCWRRVQGDIHQQRLHLKNELTSAGELSIETQAHPYHNAREIIVSIEQRVNRTARLARSWHSTDFAASGTQEIAALCDEMRNDLKALCDELGQQYKHVRHRAAIAELKQLRRCHEKMEENVQRLLVRRLEMIEAIRAIDPAGASAIERADHSFMICAENEGYLVARGRFVTELPLNPVSEPVESHTPCPDLSVQRNHLSQLRGRRPAMVETLQHLDRELQSVDPRRIELVRLRDELNLTRVTEYQQRLDKLDQRRAALESELVALESRIQLDRRWYDWKPNYLLTDASRYLAKLTDGRWSRIALDTHQQVNVYTPTRGSESIHSIPVADQSLARLSLCLASISLLGLRGIRLPLIVTDAMVDSNDHALFATLESFCRHGHQAIFVTGSQIIAQIARHQGLTVYELADTEIVIPSWYSEPIIPRHDYPAPPADVSPSESTSFDRRDYSSATPVNETPVPMSIPRVQPLARSEYPIAPIQSVSRSEPGIEIASHFPVSSPVADRVVRLETRLAKIDLVESIYLTALESIGVRTVSQLVDLDLNDRGAELSGRGFSIDQIERWQLQALMLVSIPELPPANARVLVACGITDPEMLERMEVSEVLDRIKKYLDSPSGRRSNVTYSDFSTSRIHDWADQLRCNSSWRKNSRPFIHNGNLNRDRKSVSTAGSCNGSAEREHDRKGDGKASGGSSSDSKYKFFLQMSDELETAPSIGPKTAERFKVIGIVSISDFLHADADEMAMRIENGRINAKVIRTWQNQTRLMCDVPNLRGHDAQILVACDIVGADVLTAIDARELFAKVNLFVKSKEGERIVRGNKRPDLTEVCEWIDAAKHGRSLHIA